MRLDDSLNIMARLERLRGGGCQPRVINMVCGPFFPSIMTPSFFYEEVMYSFVAHTCICLSLSLGRMVVRVWFPESTTSHIFHKEARYDLNVHVDLVTDSQSYLKAKSRHHKVLVGFCNQLYSIINF